MAAPRLHARAAHVIFRLMFSVAGFGQTPVLYVSDVVLCAVSFASMISSRRVSMYD